MCSRVGAMQDDDSIYIAMLAAVALPMRGLR